MGRHHSQRRKTLEKKTKQNQPKTTPKTQTPQLSSNGEIVKLLRELVELNKEMVIKIDGLGKSLGQKIDGLGKKIEQIPDRMVDYLTEYFHGEETVRWGQLVLSIELEREGYQPVDTDKMSKEEKSEFVRRVKKIKGKSRGEESSIDEVLVYKKGGKTYALLMEGKYNMSKGNLTDAKRQIEKALERLKGLGIDWIPVPVFAFYTEGDGVAVEDYLKDIKKWVRTTKVDLAKVILPSDEVVNISA